MLAAKKALPSYGTAITQCAPAVTCSLGKDTVDLTSMTDIADYLVDYARQGRKQGSGISTNSTALSDSFHRTTREKTLGYWALLTPFIALSRRRALFAEWLNRPVDAVFNPNVYITLEIQ